MYIDIYLKHPLILSDFNESWIVEKFPDIKFRPVGAELFNADGRTDVQGDMTTLTVALRCIKVNNSNTVFAERLDEICRPNCVGLGILNSMTKSARRYM
jgi:hypothetical protein